MIDVDSVYILLPDGRCIFSKSYKGSAADPNLLGGLLSAFNIASRQWLREGVRKFVSEGGSNFIIKDFVSFLIVIAGRMDTDDEAKLDTIGLKFLSKYGNEIEDWGKGRISMFKGFAQTLDDILGTKEEEDRIEADRERDPEDLVLDSLTIVYLPPRLQKTALGILTLRSGTAEEVAEETERSVEEEVDNLAELQSQGYIHRRTNSSGEKIYYLP